MASYLAAKYPSIAGLIVESPVSRISTVAGVFSCLLTRKQRATLRGLDCIDYLQNVTCPKLLIYGSLDHFNRRDSQKVETHSLLFIWELAKVFSAADTVLRLEGFGHNDIPFGSSGGKVGAFLALIIY